MPTELKEHLDECVAAKKPGLLPLSNVDPNNSQVCINNIQAAMNVFALGLHQVLELSIDD